MRVNDWRLIMHRNGEEILGYELFDFRGKPEGLRMDPAEHPTVVKDLSDQFNTLPWISR